tara:strand:+ start:4698 stop:5465 length:768 start_codon:yes stop_codon:yes gene_type:complete
MVNALKVNDLKSFLDFKVKKYNSLEFIVEDPIQIPKLYTRKEDIEIMSFVIATISWGNRTSIINSGKKLINIFGESPLDFILTIKESSIEKLNFFHRTFNYYDFQFFIKSLKNIYLNKGGLEKVFSKYNDQNNFKNIEHFRSIFFSLLHEKRVEKHISSPLKGSSCKRLNMFLRWMVRNDDIVDFGLWKKISPSSLSCPLDVHTGNVARKLNLIKRKNNDIISLMELDKNLRKLDSKDPVKYDFALFGLGRYERF